MNCIHSSGIYHTDVKIHIFVEEKEKKTHTPKPKVQIQFFYFQNFAWAKPPERVFHLVFGED